jgi:signal transduction histidine kinase
VKFLAFFLVCIFFPIQAWGYVPHEYPAIYTQQLGRIFLFIAFLVVLWSINIDETLPPVYGDGGQIKQILINLLSNAVKFTHTGGIIITAHPSDADRTHGVQPLFMEICIADSGIGIREDDLRRIFEKFMQIDFTLVRQYEGTGLGLSIARGMVELHKGTIWATSKYGEGSTFCFTLPLKKEIIEQAPLRI